MQNQQQQQQPESSWKLHGTNCSLPFASLFFCLPNEEGYFCTRPTARKACAPHSSDRLVPVSVHPGLCKSTKVHKETIKLKSIGESYSHLLTPGTGQFPSWTHSRKPSHPAPEGIKSERTIQPTTFGAGPEFRDR